MAREVDTHVKPPSRLIGALGTSSLYGIIASVVAIPLQFWAVTRNNLKAASGVALIAAIPGLVGLVVGWKRASRQAEYMKNLASQRDMTLGQTEGLQTHVQGLTSQVQSLTSHAEGLSSELETNRRSFAEQLAARTEKGGHAEQLESKAEQGHASEELASKAQMDHADAAIADKAEAAEQIAAR